MQSNKRFQSDDTDPEPKMKVWLRSPEFTDTVCVCGYAEEVIEGWQEAAILQSLQTCAKTFVSLHMKLFFINISLNSP